MHHPTVIPKYAGLPLTAKFSHLARAAQDFEPILADSDSHLRFTVSTPPACGSRTARSCQNKPAGAFATLAREFIHERPSASPTLVMSIAFHAGCVALLSYRLAMCRSCPPSPQGLSRRQNKCRVRLNPSAVAEPRTQPPARGNGSVLIQHFGESLSIPTSGESVSPSH